MREEIIKFQELLKEKKIDAYFISTADYHLSEYVGDFFMARKYLSGFTGSAGNLVVFQDSAYLFTDGRYFIQAEKELNNSGITLMKIGEPNIPEITDFISMKLECNATFGFDGRTISSNLGLSLEKKLRDKNILFTINHDYVNDIWENRPKLPFSKAFLLNEEYAGVNSKTKLEQVRKKMADDDASYHIITTIDDIAWLLNIRAHDIEYNPVLLAYLIIEKESAILFTDSKKINKKIKDELKMNNVIIKPYDSFYNYLKRIKEGNILLDLNKTNYYTYNILSGRKLRIINKQNPTVLMKAIKNETEIKNLKNAHIKDGIAVTKFMYWLKTNVSSMEIDEISASDYLLSLRKKMKNFIEPSFKTICAYNANAAMMHYSANEESKAILKPEGFLLVDSGGQYFEGTTDITRTFVLGPISDEAKKHFTVVLKGMIDLSITKYLYGVRGTSLDGIVRRQIWDLFIDYKCGTGHGVGYLLNVHEAPNGFRWQIVPERNDSAILEPGMITTNEPGIYLEGKYGIRHENEMLSRIVCKNEFGTFMDFETITMVPIDLDGIDINLLDDKEKCFLNEYHKKVYENISPYLTASEKKWLLKYTKEI